MTKEPQEECKHLWDCKEYNPKCHICGKLMRDDSFYDEDDHCNHAWEEDVKKFCKKYGWSEEELYKEPMHTYSDLCMKEMDDDFKKLEDADFRHENYIQQFIQKHIVSAYNYGYKAGEEEGRNNLGNWAWKNCGGEEEKIRQQAITSERNRIRKWAEKYMDKTTKYYGTDKHGIDLDDLLQELQNK